MHETINWLPNRMTSVTIFRVSGLDSGLFEGQGWEKYNYLQCSSIWVGSEWTPLHCKITLHLPSGNLVSKQQHKQIPRLAEEDKEKWRRLERGEKSLNLLVCFYVHSSVCVRERERIGFECACVFLCLSIWAASHTASQQLDRGRQQQGTWTSDQKQSPGRLCISALPSTCPSIHPTPSLPCKSKPHAAAPELDSNTSGRRKSPLFDIFFA